MSRPSEYTRNNILKDAVALFAERGYDGTSIRAIVSKSARQSSGDQLPFQGQEGAYFEVLKVAFEGYLRFDNFDPERLKDMPREEALRSFVYQQLRPLLARDQMSRYIRILSGRTSVRARCCPISSRRAQCRFSPVPPTSCGASFHREPRTMTRCAPPLR